MNDSVQLFDKQLSIVTKPIPKITNPHDVLIKVAYSGVCGTDLHILSGEFPASEKAVTLGHEFCGVISNVGADVAHLSVGDRVVVNPNNNCHVCEYCVEGNPHFCKTGGLRSTVGIWKNGGWANYCRVPSALVHKVPDDVSFAKAVLIEPFSCIARGLGNLGTIKPTAKILVCGGGIIGLLWASLLHFRGCRNITVTEIAERRKNIIDNLQLGIKVSHPDDMLESYREAVRNEDEAWGFDVIIDCTGAPNAIQQAFDWLRRGAKFLLFGCCPKDEKITINPFQIFYKELTVIGSLINPYCFPAALNMVRDLEHYLDYEKLGIKTYQLQDYPAALEALRSGLISKAVFEVDNFDNN